MSVHTLIGAVGVGSLAVAAGYALLGWTIGIAYFCRRTPLEVLMPSLDQKLIHLGRRTQPAAPVGAAAETTR